MLKITRRFFLKFLLLTGFYSIPENLNRSLKPVQRTVMIDYQTLLVFLDILIPDDMTPGAVQLGVTEEIIGYAADKPDYKLLLVQGCKWLNDEAKKRGNVQFSWLSTTQQQEIVQLAFESPAYSLSNRFFMQLLHKAFEYYYARPEATKHFAYAGPPQPDGFTDYQNPPVNLFRIMRGQNEV